MAVVASTIERQARAGPRRLPDEVPRLLSRLRARVRAYLAWRLAARVMLLLAAVFWLGLAIDWSFEPPRTARASGLALSVIALVGAAAAGLWRLARAPLGAKNLALALERRFPRLGESLLTVVDLAEQPGLTRFAPDLIAATTQRALAALPELDLRQVLDLRPLRRELAWAAAAWASIGLLVATAPAFTRLYLERALLLTDGPWPRATRLTLAGFNEGKARIARGSDFLVKITADPSGQVPHAVRLWYRGAGEPWLSVDLLRRGAPDSGDARYEHPLASVADSLDLEIRGGDARLRDLRLEVVEPPQVAGVTLECRYPKYLGRADARLPLATAGPIPEGAEVTVHLETSKPIAEASWYADSAPEDAQSRAFAPPTRALAIPLGVLSAKPAPRYVELADPSGIRSQPWLLELDCVADQPPKVSAQPRGLGAAITPQARIVWHGEALDDYGLAQIGFATRGADGATHVQPFESLPGAPRERRIEAAFDVAPLALRPGDQLQLALAARDHWDLGPAPHVGYSDWIVRKVVEPDELRSDLEARELNLRRRVEKVAADFDALSDSLSRIDPAATDQEARQAHRLQAERGLEDVRQARGELRSVAAALAELRDEGTNNQILSEEGRSRLDAGVIEPLGQLAESQGGRLAERLEQLRGAIADSSPEAAPARDAAAAENQEARRQIQRILERMRQRETLHEVVELLRGILRDQVDLNSATRQQRQKGLLEELGE